MPNVQVRNPVSRLQVTPPESVQAVVSPVVSGAFYEFVQLPPVATWVINHGLNRKPPVSLFLTENPNEPVYTDVRYLDGNTIVVEWPRPESGWAYL